MVEKVPEFLEVAPIARFIGWTTRKARNFLVKSGIAGPPRGKGCDTLVAREAFAAQMPRIYKSFAEQYLAGKLRSRRGGNHGKVTAKNTKGDTDLYVGQ
jgi:hypothetical protein